MVLGRLPILKNDIREKADTLTQFGILAGSVLKGNFEKELSLNGERVFTANEMALFEIYSVLAKLVH